jgi:hypothetical protein
MKDCIPPSKPSTTELQTIPSPEPVLIMPRGYFRKLVVKIDSWIGRLRIEIERH